MIRGIAVYVEGGGDGASRKAFRKGMSTFFKPVANLAQEKGIRWRVIPCGGRRETYDAFLNALKRNPGFHNILLVDSEEAVHDACSPWTHLQNRKSDGWKRPEGVGDEQCHLMVVCMESWFLADPEGLAKYFGSHFDKSKLPSVAQAEKTDADASKRALINATKNKRYHKIRDGVKLLETIKAEAVRKHCKWCERLFATLENLLAGEERHERESV